MAKLVFNVAEHEEMKEFKKVPTGTYNVQVVHSELAKTKAGTGTLLKLRFKVIDGEYKGSIIFSQYNMTNPSQDAVQISARQLSTLSRAVGIEGVLEDSELLHNKPLTIKVETTVDPKYGEQNNIKMYSKYTNPSEQPPQTAGTVSTADAPSNVPWNT
jgi:hypothetical protein